MNMKLNMKLGLFLLIIITGSRLVSGQGADEIYAMSDPEISLNTSVKPIAITPVSYETELAIREYGWEYFPFNTEKIYHFDSNVGDTQAEFKPFEDGVLLTFDAPNMEYRQTLVKETNGVFLKRTEVNAFIFFGNDIRYVEPVLRIPIPLHTGDSWEWHALETEDEDTTNLVIRGEVLGVEKVFTKLGEFDCVKIRQHISSERGSSNVLTEWFAPQIGLVKSHAVLEGSGITGFIQSVFGYDEVTFELVAVEDRKEIEQ